jgi:hypothetical protein
MHSTGALYFVVLNNPRELRYRREETVLVMVMPGPHEPDQDQLNSILELFVNDLLELYQGKRFFTLLAHCSPFIASQVLISKFMGASSTRSALLASTRTSQIFRHLGRSLDCLHTTASCSCVRTAPPRSTHWSIQLLMILPVRITEQIGVVTYIHSRIQVP